MEHKKAKMEGTKQQQTHRTQEWTNNYQRERDWGDRWEGRDKGRKKRKGALQLTCIMWGGHGEGCATQRRQVVIL